MDEDAGHSLTSVTARIATSFDPDDSQSIWVTTFGGGVWRTNVPHAAAPVAAFTATAGPGDNVVTFDSSTSTGDINTYYWQFGDGAVSNAVKPGPHLRGAGRVHGDAHSPGARRNVKRVP